LFKDRAHPRLISYKRPIGGSFKNQDVENQPSATVIGSQMPPVPPHPLLNVTGSTSREAWDSTPRENILANQPSVTVVGSQMPPVSPHPLLNVTSSIPKEAWDSTPRENIFTIFGPTRENLAVLGNFGPSPRELFFVNRETLASPVVNFGSSPREAFGNFASMQFGSGRDHFGGFSNNPRDTSFVNMDNFGPEIPESPRAASVLVSPNGPRDSLILDRTSPQNVRTPTTISALDTLMAEAVRLVKG
jgi:hypothetical protein